VKRIQSVRVRKEDELFRVPRTLTRISPDGDTYWPGDVLVQVNERSEIVPVPYEATCCHDVQVEPLHALQTRKTSEALELETPASKFTVSLLRLDCSAAVIAA
jgi:hypothetical protein